MKLTRPRWKWLSALLAIVWLLLFGPAAAGPLGGIVNLPGQVLGGAGQTTRGLRDDLDTTVRNVERDVAGRPLVARTFDRDANGARVLRRTIIALAPTEQDLAAAKELRFEVVRTDNLTSLGLSVVQLRVPSDLDLIGALSSLRSADPAGQFDYDHIYDPLGDLSLQHSGQTDTGRQTFSDRAARIGMIDGGIARRHPAFLEAVIAIRNVAGAGDGPPTPHGTAIASLLVGHDGDFRGYAAGAGLYAADVYGGQAGGGGALEIARALDWLAQNNVVVVNVSLAGPANKLLEQAVEGFLARGGVIVAAVGNGGAAAAPAYPAAYSGVIGVTSVDTALHMQIDAGRGHAMFAALGVDVRAAKPERGYAKYTGTSFAAPVVSARLALMLTRPDPRAVAAAVATLRREASPLDFGTYGDGFGYVAPPRPQALSAGRP